MNIELRRFTSNARLSQETTAFAADVWVDGKKVGSAENDDHGGATMVRLDPSVRAKGRGPRQSPRPCRVRRVHLRSLRKAIDRAIAVVKNNNTVTVQKEV